MWARKWGAIATALLMAAPPGAFADDAPPAAAPAAAAPAAAATPAPTATPADTLLSQGQLDALVAPIALYPDDLLAEVLMASTYPLEIVEGDRWVQANKALKGDALKAAVDKQSWDDSIKSLTATPDVLHFLSEKLSWTQQLGDAVLAQQPDVMDAIQRLRVKAQNNQKLVSNKQQKVTTQTQGDKQIIVIEPAQPNTIYVPYYDPAVVYGAWDYPAYPPYYWPNYWPGYVAGGLIATGLAFGAGYAVGRWASGGYWGGGVNWGGNSINVNRNFVNNGNINVGRGNGNTWVHNPVHRDGVRYNNANVAAKFGGNTNIGNSQNRMDFRGRSGNQVIAPNAGANRPNGGAGAGGANLGGANRPNVGAGNGAGANRPNVGGGQNRPNAGGGANRPNGGGANRPNVGGGQNRPAGGGVPATRPANIGGGNRGNAFGNVGSSGRAASFEGARGRSSFGGGGGGGFSGGGGGGGFRGGGGGGGRGGGGGARRSDMRVKHDIVRLGWLDDGLGFYRFVYNGGHTAYVGVMAQEVQKIAPQAVSRDADGYLRVDYERLGATFETYASWRAHGARLPVVKPIDN